MKRTRVAMGAMTVLSMGMLAAPSPGMWPALPTPPGSGTTRVTVSQTEDDGKKIVVEIQDGKVTSATVDGKPVPAERVKVDEQEIVIVDEKGGTIVRLANPQWDGRARAWRFDMGDAGQWTRELGQLKLAEALKGSRSWTLKGDDAAGMAMFHDSTPPKVMLGVTLGPVEEGSPLAKHFNLNAEEATLITGIAEGLPAGKAGLKAFDIVIAMDGKKPMGWAAFREVMRGKNPGDTVKMTVLSGGKEREVTVTLDAYDGEKLGAAFPMEDAKAPERPGTLFVQPTTPAPPVAPSPPGTRGGGFSGTTSPAPMIAVPGTTARERELEKKLERLGERLERLEALLERLVEKKP